MTLIGPVTRILLVPSLLRLVGLLLLVEAVFLAESFQGLMEAALRYDGSLGDVLYLLSFRSPEILDLALALGMLIAVYFTIAEARNRAELIILATASVSWTRVVGFCLMLGAIGACLSFLIAAYLLPLARFAERIALAELRKDYVIAQVLTPGPRSTVQTFDDITFIATQPHTDAQERGQLFVFQPGEDGGWRAAVSRDWNIQSPDNGSQYDIVLKQLRAYDKAAPIAGRDHARPISAITTRNARFAFDMDDIAPNPERLMRSDERPLIQASTMNSDADPDTRTRIAKAVARALLVPAAALFALVAILAAGGGYGRYLALPIAALMIVTLDVIGRTLMGNAAALPSVLLYGGGALVYLAPPLAYLLWQGEQLMIPVRGAP
jgi:lipopolysaccharide export LptBFGC system permease protein LptF